MMGSVTAAAPPVAEQLGRVHFVGIGGAGMSGIARILLARGLTVSGSDAKDSKSLVALAALGADVHVGHAAPQVAQADTVVVSTAIRETNPELVEARARGLRVLRRAEALASVMSGRRGIAVAGTHGKTTTTSMLTVALQRAGADPSFAIGGDLNEPGSNAHHGSGELFVAEADESDGSFLLLQPEAAVVTNVEADHLDHYGDAASVDRAFVEFVSTVRPGGFVVACADDPGSRRVMEEVARQGIELISYGQSDDADVRVREISLVASGGTWQLHREGEPVLEVRMAVPGLHNVLNAAAALTTALRLGFPALPLLDALADFHGARRRFEPKGSAAGVRVYDDYAHHPTEVAATLRAARTVAAGGRLVVAFQPHLYSRTAAFAAEFGAALSLADSVVVMDVYAAREDPVPGVTGALVADAVGSGTEVVFEPSWSAVPARLAGLAAEGDVVITLGAGDVTMIGPEVVAALLAREQS
jgi:UDP-N-acetylmuramate--alanine ligase